MNISPYLETDQELQIQRLGSLQARLGAGGMLIGRSALSGDIALVSHRQLQVRTAPHDDEVDDAERDDMPAPNHHHISVGLREAVLGTRFSSFE